MAKSPTSELFSTLKGYFNQLSEGERTPTEVASSFNDWARESAESVKAKIAEEVEATVQKMGFVKREEYDKLAARVSSLEKKSVKKAAAKPAAKSVKKAAAKPAAKSVKKASK
jgi:BMFP domain-containing protein YqiC